MRLTKRIDALNDELATRQESINLPKGRLKNQITSFKETIAKVLDKDTSLGEKIRTLFREQGITIASIFTLSKWPSGYLLKHYYKAVEWVLPRHQEGLLLKMRKI